MTKQIYNINAPQTFKSVTRVVRCPVLWIKCVVNNVMFFLYIHIIRDPVNGAILSSVGLTCHL
jgi:hypothetical protein